MRTRTVLLALAVLALAAGLAATRLDTDGSPTIGGVRWIEQPDTRTPIEAVPWCADQHGHSAVYPCKWDSRERPASGWDPQAAPVAVWVTRSMGCQPLIRRIKIAEDNSVAWACYYAPGS